MAIPLLTAPTTRSPTAFAGAATRVGAPFSASPTSCCASTTLRSPARCWSHGTRSMRRPTGTKLWKAYQAGRVFEEELVDQLDVLPEFVMACGFACAKA